MDFRIIEFEGCKVLKKLTFLKYIYGICLHLHFIKKETEPQRSEYSQVVVEMETVSQFPNFTPQSNQDN